MFLGGLELDHALEAYATANSGALPSEGLLDCGATASAGPQVGRWVIGEDGFDDDDDD